MTRAYIFCGPSLEPVYVQSAIAATGADVVVLPPARQGDVLRLLRSKPKVIGLIDGFFLQQPAVHFKEILLALESGTAVLGAASMGALRATELAVYGMEGIGNIYQMYAEGTLDGDDEVALLHASQEDGYRPLSEALVNIRVNVQRALQEKIINRAMASAIVNVAKRLHFTERTYANVLSQLAHSGPHHSDRAKLNAFRDYVDRCGVDQKREDAIALVGAVIDRMRTPAPPAARQPIQTPRTLFLRNFERSYIGHRYGDQFIADYRIWSLAKLLLPDFQATWRQYGLRCLAIDQAREQGFQPPPDTVLLNEFQREMGLPTAAEMAGWLAGHCMDEASLRLWLQERWLAATLQKWHAQHTAETGRKGSFADDVCQVVAHRLGIRQDRVLDRLAVRPGVVWEDPILRHEKATGQFAKWAELACQVLAYNANLEREAPGVLSRLGTNGLEQWFASRWGVPAETMIAAIHQRGFNSLPEFHDTARTGFMFDALGGEPLDNGQPGDPQG